MAGTPSHFSRLDGSSAEPTPSGPTESAELLQPRLRLFVLLICALFSALYLGGLIIVALFYPHLLIRIHLHPSKLINLGAALGALSAYLLLGRRAYAPSTLVVVDVGLTLEPAVSPELAAPVSQAMWHGTWVADMPNYWVHTTGNYYFPGMYTAVLPMIPGIWAIVRTLRASRAAQAVPA